MKYTSPDTDQNGQNPKQNAYQNNFVEKSINFNLFSISNIWRIGVLFNQLLSYSNLIRDSKVEEDLLLLKGEPPVLDLFRLFDGCIYN